MVLECSVKPPDSLESSIRLVARPPIFEFGVHPPSYAGGSARTDFLIKEGRAAVEVKVTRSGRRQRQVGDETILDQARYGIHPDVAHLVAVVFDLAGTFTNAPGVESDLSGDKGQGLTGAAAGHFRSFRDAYWSRTRSPDPGPNFLVRSVECVKGAAIWRP
jgi:hypothetical protein